MLRQEQGTRKGGGGTHTVTFKVNGGVWSGTDAVDKEFTTGEDGKLASFPADPSRTDYSFVGWYANAEGSGSAYTVSSVFEANTDLYAKWSENTPAPSTTYTITLDANGGTLGDTTSVTTGTDGKIATLPAAPTPPAGKVFKGWYSAATDGTEVTSSTVFDSNDTIYAQWNDAPPAPVTTYTITLDANGGTLGATTSVTTGADGKIATLPAAPTAPDGKTFKGWYSAATDGTAVTTSTVFDSNGTIYAQWVDSYTITLNKSSATLKIGALSETLTATVKDANGDVVSGAAVEWDSDEETIASVTAAGVVSAGTATGTTNINALYMDAGGNKYTAICEVTLLKEYFLAGSLSGYPTAGNFSIDFKTVPQDLVFVQSASDDTEYLCEHVTLKGPDMVKIVFTGINSTWTGQIDGSKLVANEYLHNDGGNIKVDAPGVYTIKLTVGATTTIEVEQESALGVDPWQYSVLINQGQGSSWGMTLVGAANSVSNNSKTLTADVEIVTGNQFGFKTSTTADSAGATSDWTSAAMMSIAPSSSIPAENFTFGSGNAVCNVGGTYNVTITLSDTGMFESVVFNSVA